MMTATCPGSTLRARALSGGDALPDEVLVGASGVKMTAYTKMVCSRPGPTETMLSRAPVNSEMALR